LKCRVVVAGAKLGAQLVHDIGRTHDLILNPANAIDDEREHVHRNGGKREHDDPAVLEHFEECLVLLVRAG
jgi:hypothetical protein